MIFENSEIIILRKVVVLDLLFSAGFVAVLRSLEPPKSITCRVSQSAIRSLSERRVSKNFKIPERQPFATLDFNVPTLDKDSPSPLRKRGGLSRTFPTWPVSMAVSTLALSSSLPLIHIYLSSSPLRLLHFTSQPPLLTTTV